MKIKLVSMIILCVFLLGCSNNELIKHERTVDVLSDNKNSLVSDLTEETENVNNNAISDDGLKKVYYKKTATDKGTISIICLFTNQVNIVIPQNDMLYDSIDKIEWLGSERIGLKVHGHLSEIYEIYSIKEHKLISKYYGADFVWDLNRTHIYYIDAPFSGDENTNKLMVDETEILYQTKIHNTVMGHISLSDNYKKIAFFEYSNSIDERYLVIADLKQYNKLTLIRAVLWNNLEGEISWEDNNVLKIEGDNCITKYDFYNNKILSKVIKD